jgi:Xaa-Pro aminopeptidase
VSRALNFVRPVKSAEEIELIRIATDVSAAAHVHLMKSIKPGAFEYNMDGLFINLCYACGCLLRPFPLEKTTRTHTTAHAAAHARF